MLKYVCRICDIILYQRASYLWGDCLNEDGYSQYKSNLVLRHLTVYFHLKQKGEKRWIAPL